MFDKSRITAEHSLESNYLKLQCREDECPDRISMEVLKNDTPDFLLPMRMMRVNNRVELRYTMGRQSALEYIGTLTLNKKQFLNLYNNFLMPFIQCGDWMLDYHYLCIDMMGVLISKDMQSVSYMYMPIKSCKNADAEILQFFNSILSKVSVTDGNDILLRLYRLFQTGNITLRDLHQTIQEELESISEMKPSPLPKESPVAKPRPIISKPESLNKGPQEVPRNPVVQPSKGQEHEDHDVIGQLFGSKKESKKPEANTKKAFWGGRKKDNTAPKRAQNERPMLQEEPSQIVTPGTPYGYVQPETDGHTVVFYEDKMQEGSYLMSLNGDKSGVPERIDLSFSGESITIGRKSRDIVQPDVAFGSEHMYIGRMHACIRRKKGKYYVVDMGSDNGSVFNGKDMVSNFEYELHDGDVIGFVAKAPFSYKVVLFSDGR